MNIQLWESYNKTSMSMEYRFFTMSWSLFNEFNFTISHHDVERFKEKGKIRVDKGAFLLGVLDDTFTLKEGQIYCCVSDQYNPSNKKVIIETCVVYRNPCFHPGDIRIVIAVDCKALDHLVDVIVCQQRDIGIFLVNVVVVILMVMILVYYTINVWFPTLPFTVPKKFAAVAAMIYPGLKFEHK